MDRPPIIAKPIVDSDGSIVQLINDDTVPDWGCSIVTVRLTDGSGDSINIEVTIDNYSDRDWESNEFNEYGKDEYAEINDDVISLQINCDDDGEYEIKIGYIRRDDTDYNIVHEYETHTQIFSKANPICIWWSDARQDIPVDFRVHELTRK